jgi:hypothetical protein
VAAMARRLRRNPRERAVAWLYTGPLGHLYGAVADIATLWGKWALSRLRTRATR